MVHLAMMILSVRLVHSLRMMLSYPCGSLFIIGAFDPIGSLREFGTFTSFGSLPYFGTFAISGSLLCSDTFRMDGSYLPHMVLSVMMVRSGWMALSTPAAHSSNVVLIEHRGSLCATGTVKRVDSLVSIGAIKPFGSLG